MVLVDKENVKGYVQMDEKEHTKKEYASKGLAGTALGLGIGGLAVYNSLYKLNSLLNKTLIML
jgi:hypothetical protein